MKRKCVGIWHCNKCRKTIAGGAWVPRYAYNEIMYFLVVVTNHPPILNSMLYIFATSTYVLFKRTLCLRNKQVLLDPILVKYELWYNNIIVEYAVISTGYKQKKKMGFFIPHFAARITYDKGHYL